MSNATSGRAAGAIPRGCYTTYRGNLAADPRQVSPQNGTPFAATRIAVNMTAPSVPTEEREKLTEWVNVIAFSDALKTKLLKCKSGEPIVIMGNVTLKFYTTEDGNTRIDRTIVADAIQAASASMLPPREAEHDAAAPPDPNEPPAD